MKVLYLHQHFSTPSGSTGTRSYEMAQRLIERGHKVTMVCGSYKMGRSGITKPFKNGMRTGKIDGIDVIELELPYSNHDLFAKRILTFLRFALSSIRISFYHQYDILFATSTPLTAGIPGIFAKLLRRKPFVFEVRDLWPELPKAMKVIRNPIILTAMSALEWCSYHLADACIGLSPGIVEGVKRRGITSEKVTMVPNGCDLRLFRDRSRFEGWRPEGVHPNDLMAVFAGAHGIANGLDSVLDAALVLREKGREDIKLVFIGEGRLKEELRTRATKECLNNCVFLDAISKEKLSGLLAGADLGMMILANVSVFYYGTSPNKFFDYISSGLPVLNNYPGWLADMINKYDCGLVVPPDDPVAFADALVHAADNRGILTGMGERARNLAVGQFDRQVLADRFVDVLEKVAKDYEKVS